MGLYKKWKKIEDYKFNERFGEFFYIKRPIYVESHIYKVTNLDRMYFSALVVVERQLEKSI